MTAVTQLPATALLDDLAAQRISARELLDAQVARHDAVHSTLNAVIAVDLERAYAAAAQVDDARARGESLGPLAGLPMTVKDGFDVEGLPAVAGNPLFADRPRDCIDADVVGTARKAGAVIWGKTNVPLMLGDFQSYNAVFGTTNNPHDLTRTPGGSSGGAAAALAAGVTALEIGSDIGGSLRHPANFCGVYALKPTWDTLSMRGHVPPLPDVWIPPDLSVAGPMARTAGDLRLLWDVLRGGPRSEPRDVGGMRIALWLDDPGFALSAEVRQVVEHAADGLRRRGAAVEIAAPPFAGGHLLDVYLGLLYPIIGARNLPDAAYAQLLEARPAAAAAVAAGAGRYSAEWQVTQITATYRGFAHNLVARQRLKDTLARWFTEWDAILAPVAPIPAFPHLHDGTLVDREIDVDGRAMPYLHLLDWIGLATALHTPALAAPVGRTAGGLPVGAQLIARWGAEDRLLDLADAVERDAGVLPAPVLPA